MTSGALVTVILPCFNGETVVGEALESIRAQSYRNLEIVVLDDGSTDATAAVVQEVLRRDQRVRLSRSDTNTGLIATLNRGIHEANGAYIARMDDDDLSAPARIERSVRLFTERPELSAVGTSTSYVSADTGKPLQPRPARCFEPDGARFMTLFAPPIVHPTLVARTEVLRAHPYGVDTRSLHAEDYELFARLSESGLSLMNLRDQLVTVRVRSHGVSLSNEQTQVANFVRCAREHLERTTGQTPSDGVHRVLVNRMTPDTTPHDLTAGLNLLGQLERGAIDQSQSQAGEADIRAVADLQRVDIVTQAILHGTRAVRSRALALLPSQSRHLLSGPARAYLGAKLRVAVGATTSERTHRLGTCRADR